MTCSDPPRPIDALLSGRAAAALLGEVGVAPAQAQVALAAGLAGRPVSIGRMLGYERSAVEALAARRALPEAALPEPCQRGMLVLRVPRGLDPRADWQPEALLLAGWPLAASARWLLKERCRRAPVPCLVTAGGFVAAGADIVGAGVLGARTYLTTVTPGEWWEALADARFATGRGTSWTWWPRPVDAGRARLQRRQSRLAHG